MGIKARNLDEDRLMFQNPGTQAAGTDRAVAVVPFDGFIKNIFARMEGAGTTGTQINDIHKNGTTIFAGATKLSFASAANAATYDTVSAANQSIVKGDRLTMDVDSIHTTAGRTSWCEILISRRDPGPVRNDAPTTLDG